MSSRKHAKKAKKEAPPPAPKPRRAERAPAATTASPRRRVRLPADERRESIIAAAKRVFVRTGLDGARIRDIAAEAEVNVATLFYYFSSKEQIFQASIIEPLEALVKAMFESSERFSASSPEQRRAVAIESTALELELTREVFPLLVTALFSNKDRGRAFYREALYPQLLKLADITRETLTPLGLKTDPHMAALLTFGVHFAVAMDASFRSVDLDINEASKKITDYVLFGIGGLPEDRS